MKIVIDIPDGMYNSIIENGKGTITQLTTELYGILYRAIQLPKGHGRLIDSNVLWDAFQDLGQDFYEAFDFAEANAVIEEDEDGQDGR